LPIIFYILLIFLALQLLYWLLFFGRFAFFQKDPQTGLKKQDPVSIVICARNEASNLRKNLPKVLMQSYPKFEVLVVDDASEDESLEVLSNFQQEYPHLRVIRLTEKNTQGKKAALALGLQEAQYDWLLLTDADGEPASSHWMSHMMASRVENTKIVLGYGPYIEHPEWINKWIRFETLYVALQYFSAAVWGLPYMGVGRNLLYHRSLYQQHAHVFKDYEHVASGDDDLFISRAANRSNTKFCISPQSFVYSEPKRSFKALYRQKTRHYSTSTYYNWKQKLLLLGLSLSHLGFWCSILFAVFYLHPLLIALMLLIRFLSILLIWTKTLCIFKDRKLLPYIILLDIVSPIYYMIFAPSLFVRNSSHWT
jgi:biofilm PGA synthesis N-glycosyltransferase PgaC